LDASSFVNPKIAQENADKYRAAFICHPVIKNEGTHLFSPSLPGWVASTQRNP